MKKLLLSLILFTLISNLSAQNIYNYGFDGTTDGMISSGWSTINQSSPVYATAKKNGIFQLRFQQIISLLGDKLEELFLLQL